MSVKEYRRKTHEIELITAHNFTDKANTTFQRHTAHSHSASGA